MYKIGTFYSHLALGITEAGLSCMDDALAAAMEHDIVCLDFSSKEIDDTTPALLRRSGMTAASVYGSLPIEFASDALYNRSLAAMCDAIDKAIAIGSPNFMAVPCPPKGMDPAERPALISAVRAMIGELCGYVKNKPIIVTVEDFSRRDRGYATFDDIDFLMENNPSLRFTFDSGNFRLAGVDELEGAKRYADRTVHVHLKDLRIAPPDAVSTLTRDGVCYERMPLGGGFVKNFESLKALYDSGFRDGAVIIEQGGPGGYAGTLRSVPWLKDAISRVAR